MIEFDRALITKYDKPGPRYTSYPTALHFSEDFSHADYFKALERTDLGLNSNPLSLYFHLPFCDTLCYFCGCNMVITRSRERVSTYVTYLKKEIELFKKLRSNNLATTQIHWGGGTPTHLTPDQIIDLGFFIRDNFEITKDAELGCEIDPRGLTKAHLEALKEVGFNRLSMGVQDFNYQTQEAVNRIQSEELTAQAVQWVRELDFMSINLDLMYGLPYQSVETFSDTLNKIITLSPDRIAVFNFAYVPWMKKHMNLIKKETLPSADTKLNILQHTIERLSSTDYVFIGMDHFAKPNDELAIALKENKLYRNFQGYSTHRGTDLIAFGITGISQFGSYYAQNAKKEKEYYEILDTGKIPVLKGYHLTDEDVLRRDVIMSIMCDFQLSYSTFSTKYSIDFKEHFALSIQSLQELNSDGLVVVNDDGFTVTDKGRLLVRNIAVLFDGYTGVKETDGRYSRTV